MAEPVDVGVVVGGASAEAHLDALREVPEARLLAVCGDDEAAVRRLARERHAQAFPSYDAMLGCDDLDLVVVASPDSLHGEHARRAIEAGKHVWVEPPLAATLDEALALREAASRASRRLGVALGRRFHPRSQALRRAIAAGRIGDLALIRCRARTPAAASGRGTAKPGLAFVGEAMHALDLLAFLADKLPVRVFGVARPEGREGASYLISHLTLAGGAIGTIETHVVPPDMPPWEDLLVVGTKGCLRAGTDHDTRVALDAPGGRKVLGDGIPPGAGLVEATRQMVRHVRGGPPPVPLDHSLAVLGACLAALRSAETGQPIALQ